jgi:hypothetical protein
VLRTGGCVCGYDVDMADPTPLYGKKKDGRGQHSVVPLTDFRKQALLTWLCTTPKEREPKTMSQLAVVIGVERKTLYVWKEDKEFLDEWERLYLKTIGNPDRKSQIMDTLYATATDPDDPKHVQAAKQYFEIEGSVKPAKLQVELTGTAKELSDEDLALLIAEKAQAEKASRTAS